MYVSDIEGEQVHSMLCVWRKRNDVCRCECGGPVPYVRVCVCVLGVTISALRMSEWSMYLDVFVCVCRNERPGV